MVQQAAISTSDDVRIGDTRYKKEPYVPPEPDTYYVVRDKSQDERVIFIRSRSNDGNSVRVHTVENGAPSKHPIELEVESLARQAAKGWCHVLVPVTGEPKPRDQGDEAASDAPSNFLMRLDSQNFGRCCADIVRANIKFSTQLIKDVGDGPFRAGDYEKAFLTFEQLAVGFNAAANASRRTIADGRRTLAAQKTQLSGKEIQERTAAFVRSEQLIQTAEREFSSILEGLRMYLRAKQASAGELSDS